MEMIQTHILLPADVLSDLRDLSRQLGQTEEELIAVALRQYLVQRPPVKRNDALIRIVALGPKDKSAPPRSTS